MTASQLLRELKKRESTVVDFLSKVLIDSGLKDAKEIKVEKVVEVKKELTSEKEQTLLDEIKNLKGKIETKDGLIAEQEKAVATQHDALVALESKVQRNLSDEDRAKLRDELNKALTALIAHEPKTAAAKFIELQVEVSKGKELADKLKLISEGIKHIPMGS